MTNEVTKISYVEAERPPTSEELDLWYRAQSIANRVNLKSYIAKSQWKNILTIHEFAKENQINLGEPDLPNIADRMFSALKSIESIQKSMCKVEQLELGIRISSNGHDLDIVQPKEQNFGWVIPVIGVALVVAGIIGRWIELEKEIDDVTEKYNDIIDKADEKLCTNPNSKICDNWEKTKKEKNYYKRESIIDNVKNALVSAGKTAKKGLGWGLALLIPALALLYLPRRS
jgi:hypothetical protein